MQPRTAWRVLVALVLLGTGLAGGLVGVSSVGASVQDLYANAYDLTPSLAAPPATFVDTATGVGSFTRDAVEVNGLSTCGAYPAGPANTYSVWYTYAPASDGWLTLSTLDTNTNYDTVIEVWDGSLGAASSVACNDDAVAGNRRSELSLPVTGGARYIIAIRRYGVSTMPATPRLGFTAAYTAKREVYVDQNSGFDSNTGSAQLPFRTIQRGEVALPPAGGVVRVAAGSYVEAVAIGVPTTLDAPNGAVSLTSAILSSPITLSGSVSASAVGVQSGGRVQDGVDLVVSGGTVTVKSAAAPYAENVTIGKSLTLQGTGATPPILQPAAGTAITISGGTVTVSELTIQGAATAVNVTGGTGHTLYRNNIAGNTAGVSSGAIAVGAVENFWGNATGPTHATNPGGTGDSIGDHVTYRPWCTQAAPTCLPRAGAATKLVFATSPGDTMAGAAFAAQPVVRAEDDLGNVDASFTGSVTLTIKGGTAGATLGGTVTVNAVAGVATFGGLGISYVGQGYQLVATSGALNSTAAGDSGAFDITASQLAFKTSPSDSTAGIAFPTQPIVQAQDSFGHVDTSYTGAVTLAIKSGTGTAGATLAPPANLTVTAANGLATFSGLNIDKTGAGYRLSASAAGLTGADSTTFDIAAGAATQLAFTTSPGSSAANSAFPTQPVVEALDALGNLDTAYTGAVTLAIKSGTGTAGATLGGTVSVNAVAGVASFSGLSIDKVGTAYQLSASAGGLTGADSTTFDIAAGPATQLAFAPSPSNGQAGQAFPTQPSVEARDAFGNLDTSYTGAVTLAIKSGTGAAGATLSGTVSVNAVAGVASFSGLSIDKAGTSYRLSASAGGLTGADSTTFDIAAGAATHLVFTTSPGATPAGAAFAAQPVVEARDALGNLDTSYTGAVTLAVKPGTGTPGAILGGTLTLNAVAGVASFSGLNIDRIGAAYRLSASAAGLTGADSTTFDIGADRLVFTTSPSNGQAGQAFATQPVVQVVDGFGTLDTSYTGAVVLTIKSGTGTVGATLGGTVSVNAVAGVATFSGLSVDKVGTAYQLAAASGAIDSSASGDSAPFDVAAGPATQLAFAPSPGNGQAGQAFPTQPSVEARDAFGNLDTSYTGAVTLAIKSGTGAAGATLSGTVSVNAVAGVASFSGLSIDKAGTSYRLSASAGGLTGADSTTFDIAAGAATHLVFTTSPGATPAGAAFAAQPAVEARDALGNLDTSYTGAVTLAVKPGTGTPGAILGGTLTLNAVAGVASFSGLNIDRIGADYQLSASAAGLTGADSTTFDIGADRLVFTTSPSNGQAGQAFATQPVVQAVDGFGTLDTSYTGAVVLTIKSGTGTAGATLGGTVSVNAVAGVATFSGLSVDKVGTAYQFAAASGAIDSSASGDSAPFDVAAGPATQLAFAPSPSNGQAGQAFPTQPSVEARDAFGNLDTSYTGAVTLAIKGGTGAAGATLSGTVSVNAVAGVASFSGLSIDKAGTSYRLSASAGGLTGADSTTFDIAAGPATHLAFITSPSSARAGTTFATQPVVVALDALDNVDTSYTGAVTLAIKPGTGTAGAVLGGTATVNAVAGVATFSGLSVDKVGTSYQLSAASAGLTSGTSAAFDIAANGLGFIVQPVDALAGQSIVVKVAAQDGSGNVDTSFAGKVTLLLKTTTGPTRTILYGTTQVFAVNGVADFSGSGLNIHKAGTNYVLTASTSDLPQSDSAAFDITGGAAVKLAFSASPPNTAASAPLSLTVEVQDAYDNRADGFGDQVDLQIANNPGGGTLGGTTSKSAGQGVVVFGQADGLNIDRIGVGYTLSASSPGITPATSVAFNITASRLVFAQSPGNSPVGGALWPLPIVRAEDGFGTLDTTFAGAVTLAVKSGTGAAGAKLGGAAIVSASGGLATFSHVSVDRLGTGYQLTASSGSLSAGTSSAFDIGQAHVFLPMILNPAYPDLVGSFQLSKLTIAPYDPVLITVTITNTGSAPASQFWVDFYINPTNPPIGANQPWNKSCGGSRCRYGIAWYVDGTLAPGQSITLSSVGSSYLGRYSDWPGYFVASKLDLYLYVDSWNPGVDSGAVFEKREDNNRFEMHIDTAGAAFAQPVGAGAPAAGSTPPAEDIPPRPAGVAPYR